MDDKIIRKELTALLRGGNAHESFEEKFRNFPVEHINTRIPGVERPPGVEFTPWHLLEHMRICQWDILEFIRNPDHISPDYPDGYWPDPAKSAEKEQWNRSREQFRQDLGVLLSMAGNPETMLFEPLSHAPEYTVFRELLLVADHNSFHLGHIGLFRDLFCRNLTAPWS